MSETLTQQGAEIPFNFADSTTEFIGNLRTLTFKAQQISHDLLRHNRRNLGELVASEYIYLEEVKESLRFEIARAHKELFYDVKEQQDKLSNDQKIFIDRLFTYLSVDDGIDLNATNHELAHFRRLVPGISVSLLELNNQYPSPSIPTEGTLTQFPNVSLEFLEPDLDNGIDIFITRAFVSYEFKGYSTPITKPWLEYNVQILV